MLKLQNQVRLKRLDHLIRHIADDRSAAILSVVHCVTLFCQLERVFGVVAGLAANHISVQSHQVIGSANSDQQRQ